MKTKRTLALSFLLAATAAALTVAGCKSSSGYQQADKVGAGIADFRTEVVNAKASVDSTMKALDQIAVTASSNPRPAYEQYTKEVSKLESTADKARKRAQAMREKGQAYFDQWELQLSQVKDESVRDTAMKRKAKLKESFDKIRETTEPLKAQFDPWLSSLKDLQTYLGQDLTISGVDAAKKLFTTAKTDGQKVQKSMDDLVTELNTLAATLTPANLTTNAPASR